ncbi:MAG TPA: nucleotide synthetase [Allosphingosinicella sp.]|nr:nucleotide synthetase [Allosphingosinicella sp.]
MTIEITPDVIDAIKANFANPGLNMKDLDRAPPTVATVRELEIDGGADRIDARYSGANYDVDLANFGGLANVLLLLHNDGLDLTEDGAPKGKYKTPLSLKNRKYCYVIFKLKSKKNNKKKNWQFSGEQQPFSIIIDEWDKGKYYEARKVYNGIEQAKDAKINGCMIAYFISDGAKAVDVAPNGEYSHGFNFNLDLIYKDSDQKDSYMPIIVDPDIRFPGGSGEP